MVSGSSFQAALPASRHKKLTVNTCHATAAAGPAQPRLWSFQVAQVEEKDAGEQPTGKPESLSPQRKAQSGHVQACWDPRISSGNF